MQNTWLWMTLLSGVIFGLYDIATKKALMESRLLSVLTVYTSINFLLVSFDFSDAIKIDMYNLLILLFKAGLIFVGWVLWFTGMKNLPISIITPFGALTPLFTLVYSIMLLGESITLVQAGGIVFILTTYYFMGKISADEVKGIFRNKYFYYMVGSTFLGASTAMIDKVIMKEISVGQMQFWFNLFLAMFYIAGSIVEKLRDRSIKALEFNRYLPLMSIFLVLSDRIYFWAIKLPYSQLAVIMPLRRVSIIVSAILGGIIFNEKNLKAKFLCACLIITGIALVFIGK